MTAAPVWAERAVDRSPATRRHRERQIEQSQSVVRSARRLLAERGDRFTTQELVKEAGIGLPTFYRLFASKDQMLLALFEEMIAEHCAQLQTVADSLPDPIARLRLYVTATVYGSGVEAETRVMTAEYWRLHELFPDEMTRAAQQFADLLQRQLELMEHADGRQGRNPSRDAWFVTKLVVAVFHHLAFDPAVEDHDAIADELWTFCCGALRITGGT